MVTALHRLRSVFRRAVIEASDNLSRKNGTVVGEEASSPFSFAFAFDDHNFVQVGEVSFNLFLRFSFLPSPAEALTFGHKFHISSFLPFHILSARSSFSRVGSVPRLPFLVGWIEFLSQNQKKEKAFLSQNLMNQNSEFINFKCGCRCKILLRIQKWPKSQKQRQKKAERKSSVSENCP